MHLLFETFRGGLLFEVKNLKEAQMAENAGAVAVILNYDCSPIHNEGNAKILEDILKNIQIPVISAFRAGHLVEAELLINIGVWGLYADSRLDKIYMPDYFSYLTEKDLPVIADIRNFNKKQEAFAPVIRNKSLKHIINKMKQPHLQNFVLAAGDIKTVSDVSLVRRVGYDGVIIDNEIFELEKVEHHLENLIKASFYYDQSEELTKILSKIY